MVKPKVDQEYIVMYSDDGTITLVPKIQDPFSEGPEGEYYEKDEWHDLAPEGENFLMNVEKKYIPKKEILYGLILILLQVKKFRRDALV